MSTLVNFPTLRPRLSKSNPSPHDPADALTHFAALIAIVEAHRIDSIDDLRQGILTLNLANVFIQSLIDQMPCPATTSGTRSSGLFVSSVALPPAWVLPAQSTKFGFETSQSQKPLNASRISNVLQILRTSNRNIEGSAASLAEAIAEIRDCRPILQSIARHLESVPRGVERTIDALPTNERRRRSRRSDPRARLQLSQLRQLISRIAAVDMTWPMSRTRAHLVTHMAKRPFDRTSMNTSL